MKSKAVPSRAGKGGKSGAGKPRPLDRALTAPRKGAAKAPAKGAAKPKVPGNRAPGNGLRRAARESNGMVVLCGLDLLAVAPGAGADRKTRRALKAESGEGVAFAAALLPTIDPADRAHTTRDDQGLLVPAARRLKGQSVPVKGLSAQARRYPAHQMVDVEQVGSRVVTDPDGLERRVVTRTIRRRAMAFDSMFDWQEEAARRLEGIPGVGKAAREDSPLVEARYLVLARLGPKGMQDLYRKQTKQHVDDPAAEAAANALLRRAATR